MQSASPSSPRLHLGQVPGAVWGRTRATLTGAVVWSAVLVFLLTFAVARSTATAAWVPGIEIVPLIALSGALLMALLALLPIPWGAALGIGLVLGPVVAAVAAAPTIYAQHPLDTLGLPLLTTWWGRITDGSAAVDPAFDLYVISWLMWITGGWLSWCVLRWRRPLLGLIPGAAAFATNLLNYPIDQNGYTLAILVLTLALMLWTNYTASIASAMRARVKLTGDARWDFWESGLVAMAGLIVLAIMLPPLSTVDRTLEMESSVFSSWAQFQQRMSHFGPTGNGPGSTGTVGFSTDVPLISSLTRTRDIVFTYTSADYTGQPYFRGVNVTETSSGEWRFSNGATVKYPLEKNFIPSYLESYQKLAAARFNIKMIVPPRGSADVLFYPSQFYRTDRQALAIESVPQFLPPGQAGPDILTIDRLQSVSPAVSAGNYTVTVNYSNATDAELKAAGTDYPNWLAPYSRVPQSGYRPPEVLNRIHQLALTVTAGATTPYDKAVAIEAFLRNTNNFKYTLNPQPKRPLNVDPIDWFLFSSNQGYCEFFATAMGDMLRSLGIPTRLVNGFGPGALDNNIGGLVVRSLDAHTWVETYFPNYGWIPFEPTNDGVYNTINRGNPGGANLCLRENGCFTPPTTPGKPGALPGPGGHTGNIDPGNSGGVASAFRFRAPDAGTMTKIFGVLLALLLLAFAATTRYLRPRTVMTVWKRTLLLVRLAGAERRPGETPLELGRRMAQNFPEASDPLRLLAGGFVVAAYAPPDLAETGRSSVMEAWSALRPLLLRRIAARLRLGRA
ncbi:MAG TPA: transglutaminase domain-containing protein [Candidatus Dormibacteraeota bacterium]|nr:transglutaminase domain-containing protein [Candidatus Dormibacteraeota bacterium]